MTELSDYRRMVEGPQLKQLSDEISALRTALMLGVKLSESGGHGSGPSCPTCHFVREAKKALRLPVPQISEPQEN